MNSLQTLPEDYPAFSFSKDGGKYKANKDFMEMEKENFDGSVVNSKDFGDFANSVNISSTNQAVNSGTISGLDKFSGTISGTVSGTVIKGRARYDSARFDNLKSILEDVNVSGDGTVQRYDQSVVEPVWKQELARKRREQQQRDKEIAELQRSAEAEQELQPEAQLNEAHDTEFDQAQQPSDLDHKHSVFTGSSKSTVNHQSPLKLFSNDEYNTYTKQKFNNLIGETPQIRAKAETKQISDFLNYADDVFSNVIKRGPAGSKERLISSKASKMSHRSADFPIAPFSKGSHHSPISSAAEESSAASYTSQEMPSYTHIQSKKKEYLQIANPLHIRSGQGKLQHPDILDVTNNMETFNSVDSDSRASNLSEPLSKIQNGEHLDVSGSSGNWSDSSVLQKRNENNILEESGNETSFMVPKFKKSIRPTSEPFGKRSGASGSDSVSGIDYDINASFLNEMQPKSSLKKSKVNFKKLLKFAPGEVEIPDRVYGMAFDKKRGKWVEEKVRGSASSSMSSHDSRDTHENGNSDSETGYSDSELAALNAIDDLSVSRYEDTFKNDITFTQLPNVTNVSQIDTTFSSSKKQLVATLTDVIPKNKDWDHVTKIDLSGRVVTQLFEMEEMLPNLKTLRLDNNFLRSFDGMPQKLEYLSARNNKLNGSFSMSQFSELETLDLQGNFFHTLATFKNLSHLKVLQLCGNAIDSLGSLGPSFRNLRVLNLSNNSIEGIVDFAQFSGLENLEEIDLSFNYITEFRGIETLPKLRIFKADSNNLKRFKTTDDPEVHSKLRKLSLRNNRLTKLDVKKFSSLRVLRINSGCTIVNSKKLTQLEEFLINGSYERVRSNKNEESKFTQMKELAVASPGLKILNLCNVDVDLSEFSGKFGALEELYYMYNDIASFEKLFKNLKQMPNLKKVDLRFNPITEGFYKYGDEDKVSECYFDLNVTKPNENMAFNDLDTTLNDSMVTTELTNNYKSVFKGTVQKQWQKDDSKYCKNLKSGDNSVFKKRMYYQGMMMKMLVRLKYLDGIFLDESRKKEVLKEYGKLVK